ncbi:MAG: c-type cytochrome, partial [Burkholderiales bacterium]
MIRVLAVSASIALSWAGAALAQDTAKPDLVTGQKIVSQVCAACHGPDGNSVAPANPKLAGQFADYLYKQLRNFKAQDGKKAERENPIMAGMVAALSNADMWNVAVYFSEQKLRPDVAPDKNLAVTGQKLYRGGNAATGVVACAGCHG